MKSQLLLIFAPLEMNTKFYLPNYFENTDLLWEVIPTAEGIIACMVRTRLRLVVAIVVLVISLAALGWSFLPGSRIIRRQIIHPTEMQLPIPEGFIPSDESLPDQHPFSLVAHAIHCADANVLLI